MSEENKKQNPLSDMLNNITAKEKKPKQQVTITFDKLTLWKGISAILVILLAVSIFTGGFGIGSTADVSDSGQEQPSKVVQAQPTPPAQPTQAPPSEEPSPEIDMSALIDDDAVKGDADAPVTIIEFSDFECSYCARFYTNTFSQIEEEYIETGKVKFVFRDFPLSFHNNAQKAAEAAECAGEQGKFWEMHDKLFEDGVSGGANTFKQYAADIGLDTDDFNGCLDSGKMVPETKKDMVDGSRVGVTGTPAFFINGQLVTGAQPFANFKQIIDAELAK